MSGLDMPAAGGQVPEGTGVEEIIALSGVSPRLWRLYAYFWLGCLFFPVLYLAQTPLTTALLLAALAGLAIFIAIYLWVMWPYPLSSSGRARAGVRSSPLFIVGIIVLVFFLCWTFGSSFAWLFVGVSAITGIVLPPRRAFWAVVALTLLTLGVCVVSSGGVAATDWLQVVPLALLVRGVGLDMAGLSRLAEALWELNVARQELARQAVVEERLRMARDLHDLLGRTLSLITLKSELARRLIEKDSVQAIQEVNEIERVARQALREVREAIAGYRKQTLAGELEGARQILEAAGITCRIEDTAGALLPSVDVLLAWVVREGVTNVIRHSRAKHCLIRIANQEGVTRTEVINDGYRGLERLVTGTGTGLSGLAERITARGGRIEAARFAFESQPGFRLMVELPIQSNLAGMEQSR